MKTSLYCLVIAVLLRLAFDVTGQTVEVYNIFGKQDDKNWKNAARQIFICGGDYGRWMTVGRINTKSPDQKGFEPNWTYVICKFKPVVKQLPNGMYQIIFTSDFTKDLP
jgi:hypothetical protein